MNRKGPLNYFGEKVNFLIKTSQKCFKILAIKNAMKPKTRASSIIFFYNIVVVDQLTGKKQEIFIRIWNFNSWTELQQLDIITFMLNKMFLISNFSKKKKYFFFFSEMSSSYGRGGRMQPRGYGAPSNGFTPRVMRNLVRLFLQIKLIRTDEEYLIYIYKKKILLNLFVKLT